MTRQNDLDHLYRLLADLEQRVGGKRRLKNCDGYMDWPTRGVYFFFEPGETRDSTDQLRVTRVGTHATSEGSSQSLWDRLKQHYGTGLGSENHPHGGAHRGSVYRKEVGKALIEKHALHDEYPDWSVDRISNADRDRGTIRDEEYPLERRVSTYLREQPFLWVEIDDEPGSDSDRAYIERNCIALLSNYESESIDPRSECWLGHYSPQQKIRTSGLWNNDHVENAHNPDMLDTFERYIESTPSL